MVLYLLAFGFDLVPFTLRSCRDPQPKSHTGMGLIPLLFLIYDEVEEEYKNWIRVDDKDTPISCHVEWMIIGGNFA